MKLHFVGNSHAARYLCAAARVKGFEITDYPQSAELVFVSEDTPTDQFGNRDLQKIKKLIMAIYSPVVLTSQVPPGFTRSLGRWDIIHQAETLNMDDAMERAMNPEQIIAGKNASFLPPITYLQYLAAFSCPVHWMSWEEAEFSKIAINMYLASQVDTTNRLAAAAKKIGANWERIKRVVDSDRRIGTYTKPGRWQDSIHLLRDFVTLKEIECE